MRRLLRAELSPSDRAVSILYWRCRRGREGDLPRQGAGFNSLLEMRTTCRSGWGRARRTCRFQFSIGDAGSQCSRGSSGRGGSVSILYWRCTPAHPPIGLGALKSFNSLLEMLYLRQWKTLAAEQGLVSILYWRCTSSCGSASPWASRCFNSLLEMQSTDYWSGDRPQVVNVSILYWRCATNQNQTVVLLNGIVSILYWRCSTSWRGG